jgi:uncharacterized protein YbaP (TraB family)
VRAAAVAIVAVAACASRPPCAIPAVANGPPLMWRVHRADGPVVWLFGTIHDAGASAVPDAAWTALAGASRFASELGDFAPDRDEFRTAARLPFGQALDQQLPRDDWWELVTALRGAVREDDLRHARPWFALFQLDSHLARSPRPSMDTALADRAKQRAIPIDRLETWQEQIAALEAAVTPTELSRAIHERGQYACDLDRLRAAYTGGDIAVLGRMLGLDAASPLLVARNERWLPQLERYAAGGGAFVAVGLGHLLGDRGLLALLAGRGYAIERSH